MAVIRQKGTRVVPVSSREPSSREISLADVRKLARDEHLFVRYQYREDALLVLEVADRIQDIQGYGRAQILTAEELETKYGKEATAVALEKFYAEQDEVAAMYREAHAKAQRKKAKE